MTKTELEGSDINSRFGSYFAFCGMIPSILVKDILRNILKENKKLYTRQCCGSGMFIQIRFFPSGSRIPGQKNDWFGSATKNLGIFNPKTLSKLKKLSGMFIPDPDFLPSRIQESKALDPGFRIRIPNTATSVILFHRHIFSQI